jgi:hypothetical protein
VLNGALNYQKKWLTTIGICRCDILRVANDFHLIGKLRFPAFSKTKINKDALKMWLWTGLVPNSL